MLEQPKAGLISRFYRQVENRLKKYYNALHFNQTNWRMRSHTKSLIQSISHPKMEMHKKWHAQKVLKNVSQMQFFFCAKLAFDR